MMHQGRYISSALLLFFASIMAGFVALPVVAVSVRVVNSEDEALKHCKEIGRLQDHETVYSSYALYPDQQGNDVFYNCGYERVEETGVNRSKKDCKSASKTYKDTSIRGVRYQCYPDGSWILMQCYRNTCVPLFKQAHETPDPVMEELRKLFLRLKGG